LDKDDALYTGLQTSARLILISLDDIGKLTPTCPLAYSLAVEGLGFDKDGMVSCGK
jgi:hypothetical protein